jgi:hypothetical protein
MYQNYMHIRDSDVRKIAKKAFEKHAYLKLGHTFFAVVYFDYVTDIYEIAI